MAGRRSLKAKVWVRIPPAGQTQQYELVSRIIRLILTQFLWVLLDLCKRSIKHYIPLSNENTILFPRKEIQQVCIFLLSVP